MEHLQSNLHKGVAGFPDDVVRRCCIVSTRAEAERLKAGHEPPHEGNPVHHEEHEEPEFQRHVDEVLQLVPRHELHGQLPRCLDDGQDDEETQAVGQDILRAGDDHVLCVVVHKQPEDVDVRDFCIRAGLQLRRVVRNLLRARALICHCPEARAHEECTKVKGKPCAQHELPDELFPILDAEGDHHARNRGHDDEDGMHRFDRTVRERREVLVKCAAEPRPRRGDVFRSGRGKADPRQLKDDQPENGEHEKDVFPTQPSFRRFFCFRCLHVPLRFHFSL